MILVQGITSGGTLAAVLPDRERAEEWIETMERTSGHGIAWSLTETQSTTVNDAIARLRPTTTTTTPSEETTT